MGNVLVQRNKVEDSTGVFGWGKDVVYLTSPGRPTDIGLTVGQACYPCSR